MSDMLFRILQKHNCFSLVSNWKSPVDDIVSEINHSLLSSDDIPLSKARDIMCDIWQYQRTLRLEEFVSTDKFKIVLNELLLDPCYSFDGRYIRCKKMFSCSIIKDNQTLFTLNDKQIEKMSLLGYGISEFVVVADARIHKVHCTGNHPNVKYTGLLCIDNYIEDTDISVSVFKYIEESLQQADIFYSYLKEKEIEEIRNILKE